MRGGALEHDLSALAAGLLLAALILLITMVPAHAQSTPIEEVNGGKKPEAGKDCLDTKYTNDPCLKANNPPEEKTDTPGDDPAAPPEEEAPCTDTTSYNSDPCSNESAPEEATEGCDIGIFGIVTSGDFSTLMGKILGCGWAAIWGNVITDLNVAVGELLASTAFSLPDIGKESELTTKYDGLVDKVKGGLILGVLILGLLMMINSANHNTHYAVLNGLPKIVFVALALAFFPDFMTMLSDLATGLGLSLMEENKLGELLIDFMTMEGVLSPAPVLGMIVMIILAALVFAVSLIKTIIFSLLYILGPIALICYPLPGLAAITHTWFRAVIACFAISLLYCVEMLVGSWIINSPSLIFGNGPWDSELIQIILACILLWIMWKTPFKVLEWACQGHYTPGRGALGMISDTLKHTAKSAAGGMAKGAAGAMIGGAIGGGLAAAGASSRKGLAHAGGNAAGKKLGEKLLSLGGGPKGRGTGGDSTPGTASGPSQSPRPGIRDAAGPNATPDPQELLGPQPDAADQPAEESAHNTPDVGTRPTPEDAPGAALGSSPTATPETNETASPTSSPKDTAPTTAAASSTDAAATSEPMSPSQAAGAAAAAGHTSATGLSQARQAYDSYSNGPAYDIAAAAGTQAYNDTLESATKDARNMAVAHQAKSKSLNATADKTSDAKMRGKLRTQAVRESQAAASVKAGASQYAAQKATEAYATASAAAHKEATTAFAKGAAGAMAATAAASAMRGAKNQATSEAQEHKAKADGCQSQSDSAADKGAAKAFRSQAIDANNQARAFAKQASESGYGGREAADAHSSEYQAAYSGITGSQPKNIPKYDGPGSNYSSGGRSRDGATAEARKTRPKREKNKIRPKDKK